MLYFPPKSHVEAVQDDITASTDLIASHCKIIKLNQIGFGQFNKEI